MYTVPLNVAPTCNNSDTNVSKLHTNIYENSWWKHRYLVWREAGPALIDAYVFY